MRAVSQIGDPLVVSWSPCGASFRIFSSCFTIESFTYNISWWRQFESFLYLAYFLFLETISSSTLGNFFSLLSVLFPHCWKLLGYIYLVFDQYPTHFEQFLYFSSSFPIFFTFSSSDLDISKDLSSS